MNRFLTSTTLKSSISKPFLIRPIAVRWMAGIGDSFRHEGANVGKTMKEQERAREAAYFHEEEERLLKALREHPEYENKIAELHKHLTDDKDNGKDN